MNDDHSSNNWQISTTDLVAATDYLDELIDVIRESHSLGTGLDVERLTLLMLTTFCGSGTPDRHFIAQQALLLSIALQRLAA